MPWTSRFSPSRGIQRLTRRLPLTVKVPLLLSAILVGVMGAALLAAHSSLRSSSLDRAQQRLARGARQLALTGTDGIAGLNERYWMAANDSLVARALRGERVNPAPALDRLVSAAGDSLGSFAAELWTGTGTRVALVGNADLAPVSGGGRLPERVTRAVAASDDPRLPLRVTPLYGDRERALFWFVMPVRQGGRLLGYITHQRRLTPSRRAQNVLRELSGDSVLVYSRNLEGQTWREGSALDRPPLEEVDAEAGTARLGRDRVLFQEARVGTTPWVIGLALSEDALYRGVEPVFQRLVALSGMLLLFGVVAAWLIGRSVARPLARFTEAAEMLAGGDYSARVPVDGDPEVRRLAESLNHMAAEIDAARRALERQTREAREANSAKSEFLTTMSHELRTPLNAIGGYVDLLEMELRGPVTPAQRRDLERIKASQQHLLGLISGVLDLARVEARKVAYDIIDLALDPFLAGLDSLIEPQAAARKVTLRYLPCPRDLVVRADQEKLRQILLNLLSNAIRHTPAGGTVNLAADGDESRVRIAVQDTGPGIPPDKRADIFEPFVQLDRSLAQPREGLGLGLAISRDLARGMEGELAVDPDSASGARFVLTLPRADGDAAGTLMSSSEQPASR